MYGNFEYNKQAYPFTISNGRVRSKSPDLYLVIDQRTQDVLLETLDYDEARRFHLSKYREYYKES